MIRPFILVVACLVSAGCSAQALQAWGAALKGASAGAATSPTAGPPLGGDLKLMLFGGPGHRTYLGCLNCSVNAFDSVANKFSSYGSSYSSSSIFNKYSQFGGAYGVYSPCNPYATDPPVIVDCA